MSQPTHKAIARAVMNKYGQTFADELRIAVARNTPAPLFQLLCFSVLASARINHDAAARAAAALKNAGWTTPAKMAASTWKQRVKVLNEHGYARYDESTARMLGEDCDLLLDKYHGDLRKLREAAGRDPKRERERLKEFKGIGDVGVDIFFREAQVAWNELYPFVDKTILKSARHLDLGGDAKSLARLVDDPHQFARLTAGLVRVGFAKAYEEIREAG